MSVVTTNCLRLPRLNVHHALIKQQQTFTKPSNCSPTSLLANGSLSPNLQPPTPPIVATNDVPNVCVPSTFGDKYILQEQIETSNLYRCLDTHSKKEFSCMVVPTKNYYQFLSGHMRMDAHDGINNIEEVVVGRTQTYILFSPSYGDLHSFVRNKKRLRESEAIPLFHQMTSTVADCHRNGIILRDLKLRKFVFSNPERTQLKLETLEDAVLLDDEDEDWLVDKHGCPAYVSPEILSVTKGRYSGKAADCWSLGVILYTMLVGRYPFHDTDPSLLFCKIRKGTFIIPDTLSSHAKCLIRSLLRREPNERLSAEEILHHRWFHSLSSQSDNYFNKFHSSSLGAGQLMPTTLMPATNTYNNKLPDQTVPDLSRKEETSFSVIHRMPS